MGPIKLLPWVGVQNFRIKKTTKGWWKPERSRGASSVVGAGVQGWYVAEMGSQCDRRGRLDTRNLKTLTAGRWGQTWQRFTKKAVTMRDTKEVMKRSCTTCCPWWALLLAAGWELFLHTVFEAGPLVRQTQFSCNVFTVLHMWDWILTKKRSILELFQGGKKEIFHSKAICKEHTFAADDFLTVYSVEGVGLFFVGSLWSADDLQHRALRLGGLWGQRIIIRILLSVCLWTAQTDNTINWTCLGLKCINVCR